VHPIQWRYHAEDLVRLRRADEHRRFAAPQRVGRIDPNPHQIDAVIFALSRLSEGGCILADEVGLGKTIEAGLIIAQLLAEGARRFLLIAPKPLLGQWQQELSTLFGIAARDWRPDADANSDGVFLVGREYAGSEKGRLVEAPRFDLIVIDEAHEVFASLYKRADPSGSWRHDSAVASTAWRVFELIRSSGTPVLLLTATPIQNSLAELWALVQYVDPTGTLLGQLGTFRDLFCDDDDRVLAQGQELELRARVETVLKRTLRRQAQEFLARPFVPRQARLFKYRMSPDETALYQDVTQYLLEPNLAGFRGNNRRLLLIAFHRRMASSSRALADSLDKVANRLRRLLGVVDGAPTGEADDRSLIEDIDEDGDLIEELSVEPESPPAPPPLAGRVGAELARVEVFARRARSLGQDSKAHALLEAFRLVGERALQARGSGKMVVFTESLVTQDYLRELLIGSGLARDEEVTLFRGTNASVRAREALDRWWGAVGERLPAHARPSRDIAMRLALVLEFETRSKVFISTEAGAKGLNLQFCETVVNYDLPWNPQRIEQRIGRCHRYGQRHGVTVINFIAHDNPADQLVFDILSQKLELFGTVLDASDEVLHEPGGPPPEILASALGADFEASIRRIWERARNVEEVERELRELQETIGEKRRRFEEARAHTAGVIEARFDEDVRRVFRRRQEQLPRALAELDESLQRVVVGYLEHSGVPYDVDASGGSKVLRVRAHQALPEELRGGVTAAIGAAVEHGSLHLGHPLVTAAVAAARAATAGARSVVFRPGPSASADLRRRRGAKGRLALLRVRHGGLERSDDLLAVALLSGEEAPLARSLAEELMLAPAEGARDPPAAAPVAADAFEEAIEEELFLHGNEVAGAERARVERAFRQIEQYLDDRALLLRRKRADLNARIDRARERRDQALGAGAREDAERQVQELGTEVESVQEEIERLERREDATYRRCHEQLRERGYAPPKVERVFEVELAIE